MLDLVLPNAVETEATTQTYGRFVVSPLEKGYGITLGNVLRRVLLSSLPGAAITSIRILGIQHEFSPIPHVREDAIQFILNLKQLRFRWLTESDETMQAKLEVKAEGPVTGVDVYCPHGLEVANPELYLCTADSNDVQLDVELTVTRGRGYSPAESRRDLPLGHIPVDAIFSPVRKVNFSVDSERIGQKTDYDRLRLEIWTDGTIAPEDALRQSSSILLRHFALVAGVSPIPTVEEPETEVEDIPLEVYSVPMESLALSSRADNCLKRAGLLQVGQIIEKMRLGDGEMLSIRNFGRKSLDELKAKMHEKGYDQYFESYTE